MKKITLLLSALLLSGGVFAADEIVYVDFDRIYRESKIIGTVETQLREEFAGREEALEAIREEMTSQRERLEKEELTLSEQEKDEIERQIIKMERDFVRNRQALVEDRTLRFQERRKIIDSEILRLVNQLAEEKDYAIVLNPFLHLPISERTSLNHNIILYANRDADITEAVIELFDKEADINR